MRYACLPLDAESWAALPKYVHRRLEWVLSFPVDEAPWIPDEWMTLALQGERIVGAHLYRMKGGTLDSIVTWVAEGVRKNGVGRLLWRRSLALQESRRVEVTVCSRSGLRLVRSLQRRHPYIAFDVCNNSA